MSYYLLVEGKRTEMILYPSWISHAAPTIKRLDSPQDIQQGEFSYYIVSGQGMPRLLDVALPRSIADVLDNPGFSELILVADSEGENVTELRTKISGIIDEVGKDLKNISITLVVQHPCIESWLLGNRKIYGKGSQCKVLLKYKEFHDCKILDPEHMLGLPEIVSGNSIAAFHLDYLKRLFREKNIRYSKTNPGPASSEQYLYQIASRYRAGHLGSFNDFLKFCRRIQNRSAK